MELKSSKKTKYTLLKNMSPKRKILSPKLSLKKGKNK
jgi:hypothetical protein